MASKFAYPSLDVDGWTKSSLHVADKMLSDFFLSEYSQTFAFAGTVKSFPWFIQQYESDPLQLISNLQSALSTYFTTQFNDVDVQMNYEKDDTQSINIYSLIFYMTFTDDVGDVFNLSKIIRHDNLKVTEITNILQNG